MVKRLLALFFGSKKPLDNSDDKKHVAQKRTRKTMASSAIKAGSQAGVVKRPASPPLTKPSEITSKRVVINNLSSVPFFEQILSTPEEGFELSDFQEKNYIALLTNRELKTVTILCSDEASSEAGVDNNFLSIKEMCAISGYYSIKKVYANSQIIQLLYQENKSKSLEKQLKEAEGIQKDFSGLISKCIKDRVSDIHIEVRRDDALVRVRKNGAMDDYAPWTTAYARSMATVIYQVIAAEQDVTFNERIPQAALIDKIVGGERVRVRLNTIPAFPDGFDMIMRILKMGSSQKPASLIDLGYDEEQESLIEACINVPSGGTLVAGTTGSGKTTSLASMVSLKVEQFTVNGICQIKIITVEDPPEIRMLNVTQVPVQRSKNDDSEENPFTKYMNATLRSDPDAILVGEVRDNTTAHLLQHAIQSGHQVFTTLHTSSAIEQVDRLRSMGIKSKVLGNTSFISGLIYQTLVPIVCKKCALDINQFEEENAHLRHRVKMLGRLRRVLTKKELKNVRFKNHLGCSSCVSGISGRTVVAEVIVPSKKMKQLFSMDEDTKALDLYLEGGGRLIMDHAIDKVVAGLCDPTDVEYKVGMIDSGMSMHSEARIKAVENELAQEFKNTNSIENDTFDSFETFETFDGHNAFMNIAGETDSEPLKSRMFNEQEPDNIKSMLITKALK